MPERNEELEEWQKHKTPRDVARYMRDRAHSVGSRYETHEDVWQASDAIVQTGLLHLILDILEQDRFDPMDRHRRWLSYWHPEVTKAIAAHERHRKRLVAMFGEEVNLGMDMDNHLDIHHSSQLYRLDTEVHRRKFQDLESKLKRMRSVRKPEDVSNLNGIGKKKAVEILQKMQTT